MDMKNILDPAIQYARNGFPVSELIAYYMDLSASRLQQYPGFKETYMPNGKTPAKGEIFKNPKLANTLEMLADKGRDAFYKAQLPKLLPNICRNKVAF